MKSITTLFLLAFWAGAQTAEAQQPAAPWAKITAWGMHYGGEIQYRYQVQNSGSRSIKSIVIGTNEDSLGWHRELSVAPRRDRESNSFWISPRNAGRPEGWGVMFSYADEVENFALQWIEGRFDKSQAPGSPETVYSPKIKSEEAGLPPGASWNNFYVNVPKPDVAYVSGHAMVEDEDGYQIVQISKGDNTPPNLELNVSRLHPKKGLGGWATFEIEARTSDNYDPNPQISLAPASSSRRGESGDVAIERLQNRWIVKLKNSPGQVYQLVFSAEDGSGNKVFRTFDYAVRTNHGQSKKNGN